MTNVGYAWYPQQVEGEPNVSPIEPDWEREAVAVGVWSPARHLLKTIRTYQASMGSSPTDRARRKLAVLEHRFWSIITGADIPLSCHIGGGLLLPHPSGIVVHPEAVIGPNCLLFQQVTLGVGGRKPGAPVLAGHVDVGAGAKILGGVHIGEHAIIGANAVVLSDVPAGCTAVGVPARIVERRQKSAAPHSGVRLCEA